MICQVCKKKFSAGNNPITGEPNGFGLMFEETGKKIFNVCTICMKYNYEAVIAKAEEFKKGGMDDG